MTIDQIVEKLIAKGLQDVAGCVPRIAARYKLCTLNDVDWYYRNGMLSQAEWEAYCYLWRNTNSRISNEMDGYGLD